MLVQFERRSRHCGPFKIMAMGGPVRGWRGVGGVKAVQDDSGATAEIFVEPETNASVYRRRRRGHGLGKTVQLCSHTRVRQLKDTGRADVAEVEPANRRATPVRGRRRAGAAPTSRLNNV